MEAHKLAKELYLEGEANSARSVLQALREQGLIECSDDVLQSTVALGQGLGGQRETCSCLVAAAMAAGLAAAKVQDAKAGRLDAEKIASEIIEEFRSNFKTTRCSDLLASFPNFYTDAR